MQRRRAGWLAGMLAALAAGGCGGQHVYEIGVPTRVPAVLPAGGFERILVAGFQAPAGEVDANEEMVRLLRSQLRTRSTYRVIEAPALTIEPVRMADTSYWKRIGEEYQQPLIVTGTLRFRGYADTQVPRADVFTGRQTSGIAADVSHFVLDSTFVFVDGTTGSTILTRELRQEALYRQEQFVPPLAAFFECSDRMMPGFLHLVSEQTVLGSRLLLK